VELRGGKLLLRPPEPAMWTRSSRPRSDDEIVRFIPMIPAPYERSDAESWIDRCSRAWRDAEACPSRSSTWAPEPWKVPSSSDRRMVPSGTGSPPALAVVEQRLGRFNW